MSLKEQGNQLFKAKHYDGAKELYTQALARLRVDDGQRVAKEGEPSPVSAKVVVTTAQLQVVLLVNRAAVCGSFESRSLRGLRGLRHWPHPSPWTV